MRCSVCGEEAEEPCTCFTCKLCGSAESYHHLVPGKVLAGKYTCKKCYAIWYKKIHT